MEEKKLKYIFLLPVFVFLLAFIIFPLAYSIYLSFHRCGLTHPEIGTPFVGIGNYWELLSSPEFWDSTLKTLGFVAGSVLFSFLLGLGLALSLVRVTRLKEFFRTAFVIPTIMPPIVIGLLWRFMLHPHLGIIDYLLSQVGFPPHMAWLGNPSTALFSLMVIDVWEWMPLMMLIMLAGLMSIPKAPFEAAKVDGLSRWTTFRKLTVPMIKPMMIVAILIRTMDAFRTFEIIYTGTKGGPGTATKTWEFFAYRIGWEYFNMGLASAFSIIMLFLIIGLCMLLLRSFRRGVQIG